MQYYGKRLWRHKWGVAGILLILVLSTVSFRLLYGPLDRNPVSADLSGNEFLVKNANEDIVDRLPAGEEMEPLVENSGYIKKQDAIILEDIDGDGFNEAFWFEINDVEQSAVTRLHARDMKEGQKLWSRPLTYSFDFMHKRNPLSKLYRGIAIRFLDGGEEDAASLVIGSHHKIYFPSVVERINAMSGSPEERYLHPGYLRAIKLIDIDGNGREEIVAAGESNAWNQAVVSILDPGELSGHAPLDTSYRVNGLNKANEIAYWRFPPTHVEQASDRIVGNALVNKIRWIKPARQILFEILVKYRGPDRRRNGKTGFMKCYFNYNFKMLDAGTHNFYDRMVERLKQQNVEDGQAYFYQHYFAEYADSLLYWNGAHWQHTPAVNADYLRVRESMRLPAFERKMKRKSKKSAKVLD